MVVKNYFETFIGAAILSVAVGFGLYTYNIYNQGREGYYMLSAKFDRVDGIVIGSDVRISGIKVGEVVSETLDKKNFMAKLTFSVNEKYILPSDSSAEIIGGSFLGNKYIAIVPGNDDEVLKPGDVVEYTQPSISMESLIGKFIFNNESKSNSSEKGASKEVPSLKETVPTLKKEEGVSSKEKEISSKGKASSAIKDPVPSI